MRDRRTILKDVAKVLAGASGAATTSGGSDLQGTNQADEETVSDVLDGKKTPTPQNTGTEEEFAGTPTSTGAVTEEGEYTAELEFRQNRYEELGVRIDGTDYGKVSGNRIFVDGITEGEHVVELYGPDDWTGRATFAFNGETYETSDEGLLAQIDVEKEQDEKLEVDESGVSHVCGDQEHRLKLLETNGRYESAVIEVDGNVLEFSYGDDGGHDNYQFKTVDSGGNVVNRVVYSLDDIRNDSAVIEIEEFENC